MTSACVCVVSTDVCVMSAGVTGCLVHYLVLHLMVEGTLGTLERHPQLYTWYSSSIKNPASPSRFPQKCWSERLGAIQFIIYRRFG